MKSENDNAPRKAVYEEPYMLHLKATGLTCKASWFPSRSKLNSFAVAYLLDSNSLVSERIGTTEIVEDDPNPEWTQALVVPYQFQKVQEVKVKVYGVKEPSSDKSAQAAEALDEHQIEFLGEQVFKLPSLIYSEQGLSLPLQHPTAGSQGTISILGESLYETREMFLASFGGRRFPVSAGFFTTPQIFMTISRQNEGGTWTMVWRGGTVDVTSNLEEELSLGTVRLSLTSLCNGDRDRPLKVTIWCFQGQGKHEPKGSIITSVARLLESATLDFFSELDATNLDRGQKRGELLLKSCQIESGATFTQYLQGGCEISLLVAIDFTYSNGVPTDKNSLHHLTPRAKPSGKAANSTLNPYQQAILSVGNILEEYDQDKMYPVYGFGAELPPKSRGQVSLTSHCFNLHPEKKEVKGIDGVLQLYETVTPTLKFSSPTYFTQIIEEATAIAAAANCSQSNQKYFILLILTDGVIHDMESTIEAIIKASEQPLSVIIVGISRESDRNNFSRMKVLDSDDKLLQHGSLVSKRDIVQFVPFLNYFSRGMDALAEEVLAEIPDQLVGYMEDKGILPNASPRTAPTTPKAPVISK